MIQTLKQSYVNISGRIYDSEFINLAHLENDKISFGDKTLFLTNKEKERLNQDELKKYEDVIYIFKNNGSYGLIADLPIQEYRNNRIKLHELVLPDKIQGMLSNYYDYNSEVAPVLLAHEKKIDYEAYIKEKTYIDYHKIEDIEIYVYTKDVAQNILKEFSDMQNLYVADGHHRLYATSLTDFKSSVLACVMSFDNVDILPIHRVIKNVDAQSFEKAKEFIINRFELYEKEESLKKGEVILRYNNDTLHLKLIDLMSDSFWNNDIYRLNTQIISQAFRIFDNNRIDYILGYDLDDYKKAMKFKSADVLIETYPITEKEFIESTDKDNVMPPKSTCFVPKFPSFLIFKKY